MKIFKSIVLVLALTLILDACTSSDDTYSFKSGVNMVGTSINGTTTQLYFSTDNGVTYTPYPQLKVGQKYNVKIINTSLGWAMSSSQYGFDWSESSPKPDNPNSATPQFTLAGANNLSVKIMCNYNANYWSGSWGGDEVGSCCGGTDANTLTQSTSDPNTYTMNNFWGDHVNATITFSPDGTVNLPQQTTSEGGIASGTGTYDQCMGTFTLATTYVIGGSTYQWQYNFHR